MSVEKRTTDIDVNTPLRLNQGNFFFLLEATGAVNVSINGNGFAEKNTGVTVFKRRTLKVWENMLVEATGPTTITYFIGTAINDKDELDVPLSIASIAGAVITAVQMPIAQTTDPDLVFNPGDADDFGPYLVRTRVTIGNLSTSSDSLRIQSSLDGDGFGTELAPGTRTTIECGIGREFTVYYPSTAAGTATLTVLSETF